MGGGGTQTIILKQWLMCESAGVRAYKKKVCEWEE